MDIKNYIKILKAMSDPARLKLLKILSGKELCVCEIEEATNMKQTTVSQQLRRLKEANLVIERKEGWWSYYSIDRITIDEFMESFKEFFLSEIQAHGELLQQYKGIEEVSQKVIICRKKEFID
jgi:ArsR family transcriptional regulator